MGMGLRVGEADAVAEGEETSAPATPDSYGLEVNDMATKMDRIESFRLWYQERREIFGVMSPQAFACIYSMTIQQIVSQQIKSLLAPMDSTLTIVCYVL